MTAVSKVRDTYSAVSTRISRKNYQKELGEQERKYYWLRVFALVMTCTYAAIGIAGGLYSLVGGNNIFLALTLYISVFITGYAGLFWCNKINRLELYAFLMCAVFVTSFTLTTTNALLKSSFSLCPRHFSDISTHQSQPKSA
jgi:hypothetical protein